MKRLLSFMAMLQMALLMGGCSTAFKSTAFVDDLYDIHSRTEIAERRKAEAELAQAQAEARAAEWNAKIAEARAKAAANEYSSYNNPVVVEDTNSYQTVLADSYESAYARRLYGFSSPSYRMPSSYYTLRYSDAFNYATAYDPAFYNIMVSGNQVWVEPKYITSMFGSWGAQVAFPSYSWYYGWSVPYHYAWMGFPHYSWYDWSWGHYCNPYWGWGFGYGWSHPFLCYHFPHHHDHHYGHHYAPSHPRPVVGGGRPSGGNVVRRPVNQGSGAYGGNRPASSSMPSAVNNGSVRRGGTTTGSGVYRGQTNSGSSYRGGSSSSSSGSYRGSSSGSSYNRGSSSSSYNSRSSSSSSSYGRSGGYSSGSGGYSGGNSSGGSHGGGQSRR